MTDPGTLIQRIAQNLPHIDQDQKSITFWVGKALEGESTDSLVEGHNLAIKLQRAFEETIFKGVLNN